MNKVILMGILCKDPELKYIGEKNTPIANFLLAVNRDFKNSQGIYDTDFINCDLWGSKAETLCKYVTKGKPLIVEGKLRLNKYKTKNGEQITQTKVYVNSFTFVPHTKNKNNAFNSSDVFTDVFTDEIYDGEISESEIPF